MPWKNGKFQWTRDEALADATSGRYGSEHDDRVADMVAFENGVRVFYAEKFRAVAGASLDATERHTYHDAANLLDPYHQRGDCAGWEETTMDDAAPGGRWVKPV